MVSLEISCSNCEKFIIKKYKGYCIKNKKKVWTYEFCNEFSEDKFIKETKLNKYKSVVWTWK